MIVGGVPVSAVWAQEIGADAYADNPEDAAKVALKQFGMD
jgi:methanogenic corrinoid protein MtbC1